MTAVAPFLEWVQATGLAQTLGGSLLLTGFLSSVHLLGLTLVAGGAFVSSLRLVGVMLPDRPVSVVTRAARRGIVVGLVVSVSSGLLLFAPRALSAFENSFFRMKMLLLLVAVLFHFFLYRTVTRHGDDRPLTLRVAGIFQLTLWFGVVVAGCAFILIE